MKQCNLARQVWHKKTWSIENRTPEVNKIYFFIGLPMADRHSGLNSSQNQAATRGNCWRNNYTLAKHYTPQEIGLWKAKSEEKMATCSSFSFTCPEYTHTEIFLPFLISVQKWKRYRGSMHKKYEMSSYSKYIHKLYLSSLKERLKPTFIKQAEAIDKNQLDSLKHF